MQMAMFMKNVSMLGAVLLISQLGAGPFSLGARRREQQLRHWKVRFYGEREGCS
jgi:hypothetical protein